MMYTSPFSTTNGPADTTLSTAREIYDTLRRRTAGTSATEDWLRHAPPSESRFWGLLDGDHAEMFGLFSRSELQLLQDWIRVAGGAEEEDLLVELLAPAAHWTPAGLRATQRFMGLVHAGAA